MKSKAIVEPYRTDHLGSIREVIDSTGTLTARYDYDAWGVLEPVSGSEDLDDWDPVPHSEQSLGSSGLPADREHIRQLTGIGLDAHRRYFLCLRVDTN